MSAWQILLVEEVANWFTDLTKNDPGTADLVEDAIDRLAVEGPALGRPLVDRIRSSRHHNMKELRPGSRGSSEVRILFAPGRVGEEVLPMSTLSWEETKRRAEEARLAAGYAVRTDADRAAGQRRLDDEIRAWRLAEVRRNRSLTQREVAAAMGVSGPRVSDVERGRLETVSVAVLRAYVEALGGHLTVTAEFEDSSYHVA
jgi:predicted XRE-type DNA-binding protein